MPAIVSEPPGLTTTEAPFIEEAKLNGKLFISQPYEQYSEANQDTWRLLYRRMQPRWERYANDAFRRGIQKLRLDSRHIPHLEDVNRFLQPLTGFEAKAVSGYVPAPIFFECLRQRQFPTTITIRCADALDYLPEPDIFHDICGHVPMHTDPALAKALVRFGECARAAAAIAADMPDKSARKPALRSMIRALARFFWFTVEFGLMRSPAGLRVYGSGLLSSFGEIEHAIQSPEVQRFPLQMEWVINQGMEIDHYQPLLFIVDSFDHLYELVGQLEIWIKQGKLSNVAPGEPQVGDEDLRIFLEGTQAA
ncbi:MAG TPA: phenylalanine 4-monooxygenase [Bryobacteraceae bacterium]|nr:phenylalanine 4-monooxygenase [Bryobacteraceae bacterium]